jgi:hypothetical protein
LISQGISRQECELATLKRDELLNTSDRPTIRASYHTAISLQLPLLSMIEY